MMAKSQKTPKQKLPNWITSHFRKSLDSHEALCDIIRLSVNGISILRGMPNIVKVLAKVQNTGDHSAVKQRILRAEKDAALAQSEMKKHFPILHGLAVVALWSWLEHFVKGFVTLWLVHREDALAAPAIQKLKIKLGDYLRLDKHEQASYLVELLEYDLASSLRLGVSRFDSLLDPFSLNGELSEDFKKTLFELQQIRNAFAHRNGLVDRRLRDQCPWLDYQLHHPVKVTPQMFHRYAEASAQYLLMVFGFISNWRCVRNGASF